MVCLRFLALAALTCMGCSAADYPIQRNVRYAPFAETVLDVMQPRSPALKDRSAVIMIHGGGWTGGTKEDALSLCTPLLDQGFVVANIDYRLAGVAPAPAAVQDVLSAAKWLHARSADYHVDPNKIILAGFSAGGHLALLAAMLPVQNDFGPVTKIAAVLDFYGPADLARLLEGTARRPYLDEWIPQQPGRMELIKRLSPIHYARKDLPPILAIHGDADELVPYEQSVLLNKTLKESGAKSELITISGGKHGFTAQQESALWPQIFKWLKKNKLV